MNSRSSDIEKATAADPLSVILQDLRLSGVAYGRCEMTRPWGIAFPAQRAARFHFVAEGSGWLFHAGEGWIRLSAGDVALLPHGAEHALTDAARGATKPLGDFPLEPVGDKIYHLRGGGAGTGDDKPPTLLFCCSVQFDAPTLHPLLSLMPPVLLVRGAASGDTTLPVFLEAMTDEVLSERIGAATILTRLADVVITRVIRAWVENRESDTTGWLAAIRDPQMGRALAAIHREPGQAWTVETLATVAQLSRSQFSARFGAVVGVSPARYLAQWRMHVAGGWLHERMTVAEAASRLGYESEASFSRAFKRLVGVPPSTLRRPAERGNLPMGNQASNRVGNPADGKAPAKA